MNFQTPQIKRTQLFINNQFVESSSGKTIPVINPANEEVICQVFEANEDDVNKAVNSAFDAFDDDAPWRTMSPAQRGQLMYRLADLILANLKELTELESYDNGKILADSEADIKDVAACLRYFAGWADKNHGQVVDYSSTLHTYTVHEPIGVCALITPWNYPLLMAAWKLGPALAAGNTVVLKPPEQTPLTCLRFCDFVVEAGFPPGVVNVITGAGSTGSLLTHHPKVDRIAFTGSNEVGRLILKASAASNLKIPTLELGGKSPLIVAADCNMEEAVEGAYNAMFWNMSQNCTAASRLFIERPIYEKFIEKLAARAQKNVIGDGLDPKTTFGPLVDKDQLEKSLKYIEIGKKEGAKLVVGGKRLDRKGYFVEPTIFCDVTDNMTIAKEEIFGPVLSVMTPFDDLDEAIKRANDTPFGLAAGVYTNDIRKAQRATKRLKAGTIWVNTYNLNPLSVTFGGVKESGFGKDLGEYALRDYTSVKAIQIQL